MSSKIKKMKQMDNVHSGPWTSRPIGEPVASTSSTPYDSPMTDLTRQEVDAKIGEAAAKVEARLASFELDVKGVLSEIRVDIANMRADTAKQTHESVKWIIGSVFGLLSLAVAIIGAMINFSKSDKPPAQQPSQSAPIVITVPGVAAAPPATVPNWTVNPQQQQPKQK